MTIMLEKDAKEGKTLNYFMQRAFRRRHRRVNPASIRLLRVARKGHFMSTLQLPETFLLTSSDPPEQFIEFTTEQLGDRPSAILLKDRWFPLVPDLLIGYMNTSMSTEETEKPFQLLWSPQPRDICLHEKIPYDWDGEDNAPLGAVPIDLIPGIRVPPEAGTPLFGPGYTKEQMMKLRVPDAPTVSITLDPTLSPIYILDFLWAVLGQGEPHTLVSDEGKEISLEGMADLPTFMSHIDPYGTYLVLCHPKDPNLPSAHPSSPIMSSSMSLSPPSSTISTSSPASSSSSPPSSSSSSSGAPNLSMIPDHTFHLWK